MDRIAVSQAKPSTVCRWTEVNRVIARVQLSMGSVFLQPSPECLCPTTIQEMMLDIEGLLN